MMRRFILLVSVGVFAACLAAAVSGILSSIIPPEWMNLVIVLTLVIAALAGVISISRKGG